MTVDPSFGRIVQQMRRALDMTQSDLAQRVACARVTVQKIESGKLRPSVQLAEQLAYHLAVPLAERPLFIHRARQRTEVGSPPIPSTIPALPSSSSSLSSPLAPLTTLIGRQAELSAICVLCASADTPLVTLLGAPGIGKTRLAIAAAQQLRDQFRDGALLISLAPIIDPSLLVPTIALALGVRQSLGDSLLDDVKRVLRDRKLLLVLDNFEQIVSAAPVLSDLLSVLPGIHVLVTSRERLQLLGEQLFEVTPLALPDLTTLPPLETLSRCPAIELFVQRARAVRVDFELSEDNAASVTALCYHLDGLPLAIELAAARVRLFTPNQMLKRLSSRFEWLTQGPRDAPARHQTLFATIDWSFELLSEGEKLLFRRLGVFSGAFDLAAAVAVAGEETMIDIWEGVASLIDKSLLQRDSRDESPAFIMLESIREFARLKLFESDEASAIQDRHLAFYVGLAEQAEGALRGPEANRWLIRLTREDNLLAALRWAERSRDTVSHLRLVAALAWFWELSGQITGGRQMVERALQHVATDWFDSEQKGIALAKALNAAGRIAASQDDQEAARHFLKLSLSLARRLEKESLMIESLHNLGNVALHLGEADESHTWHAESLELATEIQDGWGMAWAHMGLGHVAQHRQDFQLARMHFEESLRLRRRIRDPWGIARSLSELGEVAWALYEHDAAYGLFRNALSIHRKLGHEGFVPWLQYNLGRASVKRGEIAEAAALFRDAAALFREQRRTTGMICALVELAKLSVSRGLIHHAAYLMGAVDASRGDSHIWKERTDESEYVQCCAAIETEFSKGANVTAWTTGQSVSLEDACDYAVAFGR